MHFWQCWLSVRLTVLLNEAAKAADAVTEVVADTEAADTEAVDMGAVVTGVECLVAAAVTTGECRVEVSHGAAVQEGTVPGGILILAILHALLPQKIILFPIAVLLYLDRVPLRDRSIPLRTELPGRL